MFYARVKQRWQVTTLFDGVIDLKVDVSTYEEAEHKIKQLIEEHHGATDQVEEEGIEAISPAEEYDPNQLFSYEWRLKLPLFDEWVEGEKVAVGKPEICLTKIED